MNKQSFVLYESVYKQFQIIRDRLGDSEAVEYINAIMEFGLYGVIPEEESSVMLYGFEQAITSIDRAKQRHEWAVEGGKKGGRPQITLSKEDILEQKEIHKTWKNTAEYFGIDVDTLRKIRKNYGI